jgi:predicted HicB family RNase H-like nuclease
METKDLNYYKNLHYRIIIEKEHDEGVTWFIAYTKELGKLSCYGQGNTEIEALGSFHEEKDSFLEFLFEKGKTIPEPETSIGEYDHFSGVFNIRTSKILHCKIVQQANELDLSMNLYLNQIIAEAIGMASTDDKVLKKLNEICAKIDYHHAVISRQLQYNGVEFENSNSSNYKESTMYKVAG